MTVNNQSEPEIHISEKKLQKLGWILLSLAVIFTIIGALVSPLDEQGKPVLFCPRLRLLRITGDLLKHGYLS
jgi:hypothetical protein